MLCYVWVGTGYQYAKITVVGPGGPNLLTVDDPVIAVLFCSCPQACQIRAAAGFREQLTPDLFAACQLRQVVLFLLVTGIGHHRGGAHALANDEGTG